ncbi:hypothetical protein QUB80_09370 [Chlorogloeopsis sp. ULAP01]|nr:hypothetical protein [Chlorogloeopsis sp. ULAP01]MDM9380912.1 hypothetical protein [Chlorogloeopsis sp. ULAP01]
MSTPQPSDRVVRAIQLAIVVIVLLQYSILVLYNKLSNYTNNF